tara:strand:- start:910 stop:1188 length:279 start_codon:yes stop_codon:yes gene_type:complete
MVEINQEIKNRIKLSIAAYAYEYKSDPIMSDDEFDQLALKINPEEKTGYIKLDNYFRKHFTTDTGLWVHKHPELNKLDWLYNEYFKKNKTVT